MGWERFKDSKFKELHIHTAFHRADGPSSIITYLENVLSQSTQEERS